MSHTEPDLSGQTLGHCQLVRAIAQGGMGVVYEAIQTKLSRRVALKVLAQRLSDQPEFQKRFEREARAAAALSHPNMVQVHDFGEESGRYYLVMELIEGQDLAQFVESRGKLSVESGLNAVEQAAQALRAAQAKSIIHRDIKPSNLLLTQDGCVKVSDLGLAKILAEDSDMTLTGTSLGSPHFIAPEQADDSQRVDHRADIYSLGITLLFLVTGKKAFDGTSPYSIVLSHASKPLPTGKDLGTELPENVEALIRRMAAKKPEDRYADYDSLIADIQRVRRGEAPSAAPEAATPSPLAYSAPLATAGAALPTRSPSETFSTRVEKLRPAFTVGAMILLAVLLSVSTYALLKLRNQPASKQTADSNPSPTPVQSEPNRAPNLEQMPPEGFPPPEGFGRGGPPGMRGPGGVQILAPIAPIVSPLPEGPVETLFAAANSYAKDHPQNFRNILARFNQVRAKAAGTPLESPVNQAARKWTDLRDAAVEKTFAEFKAQINELLQTQGHRAAMDHLRLFPEELRSPEIDQSIMRDLALPPPGGPGRGDRGIGGPGGPDGPGGPGGPGGFPPQ